MAALGLEVRVGDEVVDEGGHRQLSCAVELVGRGHAKARHRVGKHHMARLPFIRQPEARRPRAFRKFCGRVARHIGVGIERVRLRRDAVGVEAQAGCEAQPAIAKGDFVLHEQANVAHIGLGCGAARVDLAVDDVGGSAARRQALLGGVVLADGFGEHVHAGHPAVGQVAALGLAVKLQAARPLRFAVVHAAVALQRWRAARRLAAFVGAFHAGAALVVDLRAEVVVPGAAGRAAVGQPEPITLAFVVRLAVGYARPASNGHEERALIGGDGLLVVLAGERQRLAGVDVQQRFEQQVTHLRVLRIGV
ncbi:hypothetical protein SDC9_98665 [bioreactor metagenome]|uniref:Uncharacterized protein n=1 Tax=bioreactor metagenome TaxID=1076179 RepID=A0A645AM60_9ZZZZ